MQPLPPPQLPGEVPFAQALTYAQPRRGRPGIITAVGVISIVLGSLGILTNLLSGGYACLFYFISRTMPLGAPFGQGLAPNQQQLVATALNNALPLSTQQNSVLNDFLIENGIAAFDPMTPRTTLSTRNALRGQGTLPPLPDGTTGAYYLLPSGRLDVTDDAVIFSPASFSPAAPAPSINPLNPTQLANVVGDINTMASTPLTPAQISAIRRALSSPSQAFLLAGFTDAKGQISAVIPTASGGLAIHSLNNALIYLPGPTPGTAAQSSGSVVVASSVTLTPAGVTTAPIAPLPPGAVGPPTTPGIAKRPVVLAVADAALSALLAIFLLVIGIGVFRWWPSGRKHHLIYAVLKLPVLILYFFAWWSLMSEFVGMTTANMPPTPGVTPAQMRAQMSLGMGISTAVGAAFAAIYPIALLIVMNTKTARQYYRDMAAFR